MNMLFCIHISIDVDIDMGYAHCDIHIYMYENQHHLDTVPRSYVLAH